MATSLKWDGVSTNPYDKISLYVTEAQNQYYIWVGVIALTRSIVCILGILGNLINIRTFLVIGTRDGVTTSFLFLACADLVYLLSVLAHSIAYGFHLYEVLTSHRTWFPVDPFSVFVCFVNVASCPYTVTILTTMFLSVLRCMGVSRPLRSRASMTRRNALWVLSLFLGLAVGSSAPVLVFTGLVDQFDERIQASRPSLWISPLRQKVKDVVFVIRDAILPLMTELMLSACVVVMATTLKSAAKFRNLHTSGWSKMTNQTSSHNKINVSKSRVSSLKLGSTTLSGKDLHVVQQMVLLSTVCIICNTPKVVYNCVQLFLSEFSGGQSLENVAVLADGIRDFFQAINCSVSFLIYYKFNSKFQRIVRI